MKNNLDYFTHYTEASRNRKFKALRARYGYEGQGRFWHLNEIIAESDNCRLDLADDLALDSLADDLAMRTEDLQEYLSFLEERCKLIQRDESGAITTEQVQEDLARVMQTREAAQRRRAKRQGSGSTPSEPPKEQNPESSPTNGEGSQTVGKLTGKVPLQNAQRSVAYSSVDESSGAERTRMLDAGSVREILGPVVDLRDGEDAEFASSLSQAGLDEAFLRWFIARVQKTRDERGIRNVKGFIVAFARSPETYETWMNEYHDERKLRPKRMSLTCPSCGGFLKTADGRAKCIDCRKFFTQVDLQWVLEDEIEAEMEGA